MKILLILLFLISACKNNSDVASINPLEPYLDSQTPKELDVRDDYMVLVNDYRHDIGEASFIYSDEIEMVAQEHSQNMANGNVAFGHTGSSDRCRKIITELGPANLCGEIVAMGQKNPDSVFSAWMNSPGHKSQISNGRYTHTGLGIAKNAKGVTYWTQVFLEVL